MSRTRSLSKLIGPSGSQAFDTNTLVIDAANNKVGIGTATPASRLDVLNGTANTQVASFSGADVGAGLKILTASTTRNDDTVILKASDAFGEIAFTSDNTEVMRITKDNNVGIGTDAPDYKLHVKGAGHQRIKVEKTDAGGDADISIAGPSDSTGWVLFTDNTAVSNSGVIKYVHSTNKMHFRTNDVDDRLVISDTGNVGIGTTTPSATLHIKSSSSNPVILFEENTGETQTAKIEFDQAAQNTLTLSTQYQSATNTNRIIISPAEQPAIIVRGGSQTGSGAGSSKSYGYTSNTAFGGPKWATWTESIMTSDGGQQEVRIIEDHTGRWILAGRFAANAQTSIQGIWSSVRGLSTSTGQDVTAFSADFGSSYPTECRYIGATDWTNYYNTRTIDFIHGIPTGRPWKSFMSNNVATGMGQVTGAVGGAKNGWTCRGAYDGFGRWSNPNYLYHKISDVSAAIVHSENAFINPVANAFNWQTNGDAKITVNGTGLDYSGQDADASSGFGNDDTVVGFYDEWPALISNFASNTYQTYSSAVWVMIKMVGI